MKHWIYVMLIYFPWSPYKNKNKKNYNSKSFESSSVHIEAALNYRYYNYLTE